jgi:hypothetical protein
VELGYHTRDYNIQMAEEAMRRLEDKGAFYAAAFESTWKQPFRPE